MSRSKYLTYSPLRAVVSDAVNRYVLERVLSGDSTEDVVESIHEYLTTISQNIRAGQIKMDDFIINKVRSSWLTFRGLPH